MDNNYTLKIFDSCENLPDCQWREMLSSFEKTFAVKWHAIFMFDQSEIVGFMMLLRNPDDINQWYICDIHTVISHRRFGIAYTMCRAALTLAGEYDKATNIISSIHPDNRASIGLHQKLGFYNTNISSHFADFNFEEGETLYQYWLANRFPARNTEIHVRLLSPMWIAFHREHGSLLTSDVLLQELVKTLEQASKGILIFDIVWSGDSAIGFVVEKDLSVWKWYVAPGWRDKGIEDKIL